MTRIRLTINGKPETVDVEPDMPLLWVLRDTLGMTGTKYGCGVGICGACAILEGDQAVRACQIAASDAQGKRYTTIEGLSKDGSHPCQRAWLEEDVSQCGYCQAGMIMTACALLKKKAKPTDADIDAALNDSVCRCGTYVRIRKAVHTAAAMMVPRSLGVPRSSSEGPGGELHAWHSEESEEPRNPRNSR